jgi:formylglycine-generating enzyme required for sulfatase activity
VSYWGNRAPAVVGKVEGELFSGLSSQDPEQAQQAVISLAALASAEIADRLKELIEADFTDKPVTWVDHKGKKHELHRTVLNLATLRQRRAVQALTRMALPEVTGMLDRWTPRGMVLVPAGPFTMGSTEYSSEWSVHEVWLEAFWIDRYLVTNAQWAAFVESGEWRRCELWTEAGWEWYQKESSIHNPDDSKLDHPIVYVTWYESLAFTHWAGKGLLSEAQWEKAARGTDGRSYPWGDEFDKGKCNTRELGIAGTTPVDKYSPAGDSPYGVADMAGNVWEWTTSLYRPYPYRSNDQRDDPDASGNRVLRSGSFCNSASNAHASYRFDYAPVYASYDSGFRCGIVARLFSSMY